MNKILLFILITFISANAFGQEKFNNDTVQFDGYQGVIYDLKYAPYESRNIFPKNRFKPSLKEVEEFENEFLKQYTCAIEKHYLLSFKQNYRSDFTAKEWRQLKKTKNNRKKYANEAYEDLKKEYKNFDRSYFGYIGENGKRYLIIHFKPHVEQWFDDGTGESHIHNLANLEYNLDSHKLYLAGWTGEDN